MKIKQYWKLTIDGIMERLIFYMVAMFGIIGLTMIIVDKIHKEAKRDIVIYKMETPQGTYFVNNLSSSSGSCSYTGNLANNGKQVVITGSCTQSVVE